MKKMIVTTLMMTAWVGLGAATARADEKEQKVSLDRVPAVVKATIQKEAGEAKVTEVEKETHDGKTIYSAEFDRDGKEHEVYVAEDGKLLSREVEVSMDDLPAAVKETIQREAKGAKVEEVARVSEDGKTFYEAEWEVNGKEREVLVSEDGKVVPHEREYQPAK